MSTYRERRLARAERLREWADKREARGTAELEHARQMFDAIPFGQPILVGHHSEGRDRRYRDRAHDTTGRGLANVRKGEQMARSADEIEAQADRAIYDDDPDAIERLGERIAELEAERAVIKAHNKDARKRGAKDEVLPAYHLSNLSGNIGRLRKRLERLQRGDHLRARVVANKWAGTCEECGAEVASYAGVARRETAGADWQVFCDEHREGVSSDG